MYARVSIFAFKCFWSFQLEELKSIHGDIVGKIDIGGKSSKHENVSDDPIDRQRREKVREAMLHAWSSYEKYAWGQDELQVCQILLCVYNVRITNV